ncbi:MAG TPA: hypothetical protein VKB80_19460 [Kofleriaceae bacterium]|nr:hypothetical protein [Kofleriaceae bacterium]
MAAMAAVHAPAVAGPGGGGSDREPEGAVVVSLGAGARVDWTRGLLIATGAAAGDLRAPSAELARLKAERQARDAARVQLRRLARDLALADGRELGAALEGAAADRFDRALDAVIDEQVEHASDGSVVLAVALPLEAARAAVFGPGPAPSAAERGPTAIVVDAGRHIKHPALGVKLAAGQEHYAGPTVFATRSEAIGPARLGGRPVRVRASSFRGGALHLAGDDAAEQLAGARAAGALVVVEMEAAGRDKRDGDKHGDDESDRDRRGRDKHGDKSSRDRRGSDRSSRDRSDGDRRGDRSSSDERGDKRSDARGGDGRAGSHDDHRDRSKGDKEKR